MPHKEYKVRAGDSVSSIAFEHGLFPDTIWDDPKNSQLKSKRVDMNVLLPGDIVYVREKEEREESCATEQKHRFRRKGVPAKLMTQIVMGGLPCEDTEYILEIDGVLTGGKTDDEGNIEITIPPNAKRGKLTINDEEFDFDCGTVDPINEQSGVIQRLENLGFYTTDEDDDEPENKDESPLVEALKRFQESLDLEPTGAADRATRDKLVEEHGS